MANTHKILGNDKIAHLINLTAQKFLSKYIKIGQIARFFFKKHVVNKC